MLPIVRVVIEAMAPRIVTGAILGSADPSLEPPARMLKPAALSGGPARWSRGALNPPPPAAAPPGPGAAFGCRQSGARATPPPPPAASAESTPGTRAVRQP